jgi:hypothetical protein
VVSAALGKGEGGCAEGGSKFTVGGKETSACNGTTGFTAVLPKGKTETGAWAFNVPSGVGGEEGAVFAPISSSIPLPEALSEHQVYFVGNEPTTACPGNVAEPKATEGNLCVYGLLLGATFNRILAPAGIGVEGASTAGAFMVFEPTAGAGLKRGWGCGR